MTNWLQVFECSWISWLKQRTRAYAQLIDTYFDEISMAMPVFNSEVFVVEISFCVRFPFRNLMSIIIIIIILGIAIWTIYCKDKSHVYSRHILQKYDSRD